MDDTRPTMPSSFSTNTTYGFHERLCQAIDIVDEISDHIGVQRRGRNAIALCPFHDDRKPSLNISSQKQIFKCFSCSKGGDVVKFVVEFEKIPYAEAIRKLAEKYNVEMPNNYTSGVRNTGDPYKKTKALNKLAADYYHHFLLHHKGATKARQYLSARGLSKSAIETFKIGYAPRGYSSSSFSHFIKKYCLENTNAAKTSFKPAHHRQENKNGSLPVKKNVFLYEEETLDTSGLFSTDSNARLDFFRNRIMFPIANEKGEILAFGARAMGDAMPKYLNSRESAWFKKNEVLYGLYENWQQIGRKPLHIVEGYFDVIAAKMQGLCAVAGMGTALGEIQIKRIKRYAMQSSVRLMFDGDQAGMKATLASCLKTLEANINAYVVLLPEGKDPFDYLAKTAGEKSEESISKNCVDVFSFLIEHFKPAENASPFEKKEALKNILFYFREVKNKIVRVEFANSIKKVYGHDAEQALLQLSAEMPRQYYTQPRNFSKDRTSLANGTITGVEIDDSTHTDLAKKSAPLEPPLEPLLEPSLSNIEIMRRKKERSLMVFLCHFPTFITQAGTVILLENITDPIAHYIYQRLLLLRGKEKPTTNHALELMERREVHDFLIEELARDNKSYKIESNRQLLERLTQLKIDETEEKRARLAEKIRMLEEDVDKTIAHDETYRQVQLKAQNLVLEIEKLRLYLSTS